MSDNLITRTPKIPKFMLPMSGKRQKVFRMSETPKMPKVWLTKSDKRPAATGRVANENVANPVAEKLAKGAFPGESGSGLRRSMSSDNLYIGSQYDLNAGANHVTRAPLAKANDPLVNKAASFVKTTAPTIVRKAESQDNIANVNLPEDHFQASASINSNRPRCDSKGRLQDLEQEDTISELQIQLRELKCIIAEKDRKIRVKDDVIADKDARLLANSYQISQQLSELASAHKIIKDYRRTIAVVQTEFSKLERND